MEPWEVSHIQRNKFNLQQLTTCNSLFRAVLQQHGVLGDNDVSQLEAVQTSKGAHAESELLYNLLLKRKGAFSALIDACKQTKQSGTLHILQQAHISNSTRWDELSVELKNELGNKLVGFQGNKVKLSDCCNHLHQHIDVEFLKELEKGNAPTLVNNQVPDQLEYYIQRSLRSRNQLKSSVFQQACNDVFVVEGIEKHQLTNLVVGAETDVSGNQIEHLTVRYILLEYEGDFESICKLSSSPVHLIRYKNTIYEWVKSSGSVKNLQMHVDDVQDDFPEEELASRRNRVNIIPDSPGMGKTLLLANIAHQISKEQSSMLIRFLVMKDFVPSLSHKECNLELMVSLIAEESSEFECGREIVKYILKSEPCIIMLDGFEEVLHNQVDTAKQVLSTIVTLKSAQIFVTTRPHMREELENTLHVLGYTINPFMESDQVNFLLKFWKIKGAAANETLKQFATECVNTISSHMTDFEKDIAGIPLQCRLLAECYTEQALRWSQIGAPTFRQPIVQINSIFEMYEMHMKMRLQNLKSEVEQIKNAHIYYALELLFQEHAYQFEALKTPSISLNELCSVGFLEATNSQNVRFVHRTFAEFFVAGFAVEMTMPEKNTPFLLDELLATKSRQEYINTPLGKTSIGSLHTFDCPVIAYFINGFIKMNSRNQGNHDQSHRVSMLMDSVYYDQVSRIFIASAVADYQFVPQAVTLCFDTSQLNEKGNLDLYELLLFAAKYSSAALMKIFCSQTDLNNLKIQSKLDSFVLTPLHVAVQRGHYQLVEFLAQNYEPQLKNHRYVLHFCVLGSITERQQIIKDKVQIIKFLSRKCSFWLDEKHSDGTVPILQKNVNPELIKCLIECGADVNVLDKNRNSILHKITENPVTPEFYHWLVVSLNERQFKHSNRLNSKKVSPLHCAVEKAELLKETLNFFKSSGADFNAEDLRKESPLFYAIRGGRSVSSICPLIEFGADWTKKNEDGETVLHICAKYCHYQAMKHFVETLKMDVNFKDRDGRTPLHYAVKRNSKDYELIQQFLVSSGADVNEGYLNDRHTKWSVTHRLLKAFEVKRFSQCSDSSPFMEAFRNGEGLSLSTIKLMKKQGLSIGRKAASEALKYLLSNRNIKPLEIDEEFGPLLEFLIRKGGVIKDVPDYEGSYNKTPVWKSEKVQNNMHAIVQATDLDCMWPHLETSRLLTQSELESIRNHSGNSSEKCCRFYVILQLKKGSFERVCSLLTASGQMSPLELLRRSLYSAIIFEHFMFRRPPTFINQFLNSKHNSNIITMALITANPFLTLRRIRETVTNTVVDIKDADISSYLQKLGHEDLIILKVRVVTSELTSNLETSEAAQCKIMFVCSAVDEDVQNFHVVTDSLPTWDDISTPYFKERAQFNVVDNGWTPIFELFVSPLILNKLSQLNWIIGEFSKYEYSVVRYKMGHNDLEFQSKSYLCPTIFHYVLPDKLVFHGIPIEKLKEFARFGHKIGTLGKDDMNDLDYVLIENSTQFDEMCRQTSDNVHLVEYVQEMGVFKLARTFGWGENIQSFLKQQLCEGFPHCDCAPGNKNLFVSLLIKASNGVVFHRFECVLPIKELTPKTLKIMNLEYAELFNIRSQLKRMSGETQVQQTAIIGRSHGEQVVQLITEHLSTLLVENELYHVAINTLFPNLAKQTIVIEELEKYEQLGMLKQTNNKQMVFVDQFLAWYFIAKLLMGLPETVKFERITAALRNETLQNCFECHDVEITSRYYEEQVSVCVTSPSQKLNTYKFINIFCFKFMEALHKKTSDGSYASFSNILRSLVAVDPEGHRWIHACVNSNLFHLLQLILSFKMNALSLELDFDILVVLAVNYADVPIVRLVAEQFEKKTKTKLTEIKVYRGYKEISMVSLAALRGNYGLVEYLLNDQCFRLQLDDHKVLEVVNYCLRNTSHISKYEVNERKRIIDLFLPTNVMVLQHVLRSSMNVHVDLIVYLISLGADIHAKNEYNSNIFHSCPYYFTPLEYHEVVSLIHLKDGTSIARLLKEINDNGKTAFHAAVNQLELPDDTLHVFSEAQVDFNALDRGGDSVFVHAAKCFRSARLLDALYRSGADIHAKDGEGRHASIYCEGNQTALRYLSSRGVVI